MVTPAGYPAWARMADATIYGGVADLRNLGGIGAVNAKTDVTAEEYLRLASDLARCVQTAPLLWMRMLISGTAGSGPVTATIQECVTQWGGASGSYAGATPPGTAWPTVSQYFETGILLFRLPGLSDGVIMTALDGYGVSGQFLLSSAVASGHDASVSTDGLYFAVHDCANGETISVVVY